MRSLIVVSTLALLAIVAAPATAQQIPRPDYLRYVPLEYKRIVRQTPASVQFQLYGDREAPGYVDQSPKDGVDDSRGELLHALGVRFAPYLIQNTTDLPMDFKRFWDQRGSFPIFVDTFDIASDRPRVVGTRSIDLPNITRAPCADPETASGPQDDCALLRLLREFDPVAPQNPRAGGGPIDIDSDEFKVMFFDFPGEGPESWKREYRNLYSQHLPRSYSGFAKVYVHPFVATVASATAGTIGYELVLQYWFFYPTNDGGNNHEGDWEHINVIVSPRSQVERPLSGEELTAILQLSPADLDAAADPLVIRRAEIYFHQKFMSLDYSTPNVYAPRAQWEAQVKGTIEERNSERSTWRYLRRLAYFDADETVVNTHPIAYIGADNKGLDQLLSPPGGANRDSHGTYPFPGMYKDIGPAGATEQIGAKFFDHREWYAKDRKRNKDFGPSRVVFYDEPDLVELMPDWERVHDLVYTDIEVRREWSWMVLPLRWGWPAVASPFAGVVSHAETGNLAPPGPMYQGSWNRPGAAPAFSEYQPHKLPSLFPLGWQDNFVNSWGYLNVTAPTLITLPPFDFIWRIGSAPFRYALGKPDPVYYPSRELPSRFVGIAPVYSVNTIDQQFNALWLNEPQLVEILTEYLVTEGDVPDELPVTDVIENANTPALWFGFFIGNRLVSENMIRHSRSVLGLDLARPATPGDPLSVRGELNFWEYSGSLRYNLFTGGFKPYAKAGYGLSWYRIENGTIDGEAMEFAASEWIRKPSLSRPKSLLPNTWHLGAGLEFDLYSSVARPPAGIDVSLRADWAVYFHSLGLKETAALDLVPEIAVDLVREGDRITRHQFNFMFTLGF